MKTIEEALATAKKLMPSRVTALAHTSQGNHLYGGPRTGSDFGEPFVQGPGR
jgi:hypothetical protein